jgi:hypothetical protein
VNQGSSDSNHLTVFVDGLPRLIPYGVGIAPPLEVEPIVRGPFAVGGTAFFWLHTHASDGIIHIESPIERTYTLGNFFDIWNEPLGPEQVGPANCHVTAFFNGRHYRQSTRHTASCARADPTRRWQTAGRTRVDPISRRPLTGVGLDGPASLTLRRSRRRRAGPRTPLPCSRAAATYRKERRWPKQDLLSGRRGRACLRRHHLLAVGAGQLSSARSSP